MEKYKELAQVKDNRPAPTPFLAEDHTDAPARAAGVGLLAVGDFNVGGVERSSASWPRAAGRLGGDDSGSRPCVTGSTPADW